MRIALCNEVLRELSFAAQCDTAAELGYDAIELAPFTVADDPVTLSAADRKALQRTASDAGTPIISLHWLLVAPAGLSITDPHPAVRSATLEAMSALCHLAADVGASHLVHGSPKQRALPAGHEDAARGWTEEAFAAAARAAEEAGVTYCIEPLAPRETDNINTIEEAADLVDRIDSAHLRTMLDTSAAGQTEAATLPDLIARWVPSGHIAHVQLNDPNRRGPGEGDMAFAPILRALAEAGYRGDVAVEPFVYRPNGLACAARAIGYLKGLRETA